jgi:hypothetical protein
MAGWLKPFQLSDRCSDWIAFTFVVLARSRLSVCLASRGALYQTIAVYLPNFEHIYRKKSPAWRAGLTQ